jgi:hypothetical protein
VNRPAPQTKTATASTTIAVTARSANTSLGDAVTACAAARAGLVRPAKLELLAYEEFDGATPITAHPVSTAGGFQGDARLLSLAYPALHALLAAAAPSPSAKVGFFLASPDLVARAAVIGAPSPRPSTLIDRLVSITGLSVPEPLRRAFPLGPTGFATAIQAATEALIRREASVCIVGAVDTLCDDLAIAALTAQKRLKTADNPVGLQPGEAAAFFTDALAHGHEGVVVKSLTAPYAAGRRGAGWIKVKPRHTLDLVVLAVEWGHGRRRGWLSNLHLGARDPSAGGFVMLGKTFKGLTDELLTWQTERLLALEERRDSYTVYVRPELVAEIAFDGVQRSPRYPGGLALRFARVLRYREDKTAAEADTIDTVRALSPL